MLKPKEEMEVKVGFEEERGENPIDEPEDPCGSPDPNKDPVELMEDPNENPVDEAEDPHGGPVEAAEDPNENPVELVEDPNKNWVEVKDEDGVFDSENEKDPNEKPPGILLYLSCLFLFLKLPDEDGSP